jgi:hypothetical protein
LSAEKTGIGWCFNIFHSRFAELTHPPHFSSFYRQRPALCPEFSFGDFCCRDAAAKIANREWLHRLAHEIADVTI